MIKQAAFLAVLAVLLFGCTSLEPQASQTEFKTYSGGGFSIGYPADWKAESSSTGVSFASKQGSNVQASYLALPEVESLDQFVQQNKENITLEFLNANAGTENQFESVKIVSESDKTIGGNKGKLLVIRSTLKSGLEIRQHQVYLYRNHKGFILTASATDAGFEAESPTFEKIFNSFSMT